MTLVNGDGQGLGQVISIPFIFKSSTILTLSSCDQPAALPVGDCKHHSHQDHQDIFQLQSVIAHIDPVISRVKSRVLVVGRAEDF